MHSYAFVSVGLFLLACSPPPSGEAATSGAGGDSAANSSSGDASTSSGHPASSSRGASTIDASSSSGATGGGLACIPSTGFGGAGDGGHGGSCAMPRYATRVVEACFGPDGGFGKDQLPNVVLGPPKGAGSGSGSLDVCGIGEGGTITLAFDGGAIVDGPGPDFIVFENPFFIGGNPSEVYANPGTVAVSDDGVTWTSFPCTATQYPWGQCAGWHPVYANPDTNSIDPLDPATAGGDAFDLKDIGVARARFVRITDRADLPGDFDLDAIGVVNAGCP